MMLITVRRKELTKKSTISDVLINGVKRGVGLEDRVRGKNEKKVYGETAIPYGKYRLTFRTIGSMYLAYKKRFADLRHERGTLWIRDIPGFDFVLIHCGLIPADTFGCLLVGLKSGKDCIIPGTSEKAYRLIYPIIADALERGEEVFIEYVEA